MSLGGAPDVIRGQFFEMFRSAQELNNQLNAANVKLWHRAILLHEGGPAPGRGLGLFAPAIAKGYSPAPQNYITICHRKRYRLSCN